MTEPRTTLPSRVRTLTTWAALGVAATFAVAGCGSAGGQAADAARPAAVPAASASVAAVRVEAPLACAASVTSKRPVIGTREGVQVRTVARAWVRVTAPYGSSGHQKAARAGADGRHTFWFLTAGATPGEQVKVAVRVSRPGSAGSCSAVFTPRRKPAPAPPPAPTSPPPSAAWCSATARVYNAARDWNNVYVHSNQPDRSATASADGYSHSYETDGSGYALIYLNGPPAGARITVRVGQAACSTSD